MVQGLRHTVAVERSLAGLAAHIAADLAQAVDSRVVLAALERTEVAPVLAHIAADLAQAVDSRVALAAVEHTLAVDTLHWGSGAYPGGG